MMRAKLSPRVGIARQENNRRGTTLDADGGARGTKEFTSGSFDLRSRSRNGSLKVDRVMDHKETRCAQLTLLQAFKAHPDKTVTGAQKRAS